MKVSRRLRAIAIMGGVIILGLAVADLSRLGIASRAPSIVRADAGCSVASLSSKYGFEYTAFAVPGRAVLATKNSNPIAAAGVLTFDGAGNLSASYTLSSGGDISRATSDTGTYTVNADCTGSFTDATGGVHFNLVIVGGGTKVFAIDTDDGLTAIVDAKKQ